MKFFRQTKETKRKLSFFLALAMVISLLPVTPVAKAAATSTVTSSNQQVKVNCKAENLSIANNGLKLEPETSATTQSAIITLTAEREITEISLTVNVATGTSLDSINSVGEVATSSSVKKEFDGKNVTVTVEDIAASNDIYTLITIEGSATLKEEVKEYSVTINSNELNPDINLKISGAMTNTGTANVADGKEVILTISSKNNNTAIDTPPTLTVNDKTVAWEGSSAKITITGTTTITVKGGTIKTIASNEIEKATPAPDVTNQTGIKDVSIDSPDNTNINEVTKNLVTGAQEGAKDINKINITKDGKTVDVTPGLQKQIQEALENPATKMKTSLKVNVASSAAVTEAKELVNKATDKDIVTTDISDEKQKNALGNDIKATVSKMLNEGVALDITLTGSFQLDGATSAAITISEVKDGIKVTMDVPTKYTENGKPKTTGYYYAIRIHDGKVSILPCKLNGNKISFVSDKFSTYVISYIEDSSDNNNNNNNNNSGNNNNGYIPGPGTSSSAAPGTNPSATPSANPSTVPSNAPGTNPSGAPGTNPSNAPGTNPSGAPSDPTNSPSDPTNAPSDPTKAPGTSSNTVKVGKKATISGSQYKVTAVKGTRTVQFTKGKKNAKKIVIPSTVKVSGKKYKVTSIAKNAIKGNKKLTKLTIGANVKKIGANAFKGCSKLKNVTIKTKKLTKSKVGKNAFKGINAKATIKVPKAKVKAYKKIVQAKGAGKSVKVKK